MKTGVILEILTIGFPFCVFKVLFGQFLLNNDYSPYLGVFFLFWGIADSFINIANLISTCIFGKTIARTCLFNYLVGFVLKLIPYEHRGPRDFGTAIDLFLSFSLVAFMILSSSLSLLKPWQLIIWNWAVVFNVLGAGLSRVRESARRLNKRTVI